VLAAADPSTCGAGEVFVMPKYRQNPITKEWTIISTERSKRPVDVEVRSASASASSGCPFCPGNEKMTGPAVYTLPPNTDRGKWQVRVVPNKYPITADHEVIIHSPDHTKDIDQLDYEQVRLIFKAYQDRYNYYKQKHCDNFIHLYNNSGREAGASLSHPHSQLVVFNFVPPEVKEEVLGAREFYRQQGRCVYCEELKKVLVSKERLVLETDFFAALTPFESEWPYEVTIFPRNHQADYGKISPEEIGDLSVVMQRVLRAYNRILAVPSRNFWIHSLPVSRHQQESRYYHWHLQIIPRIKTLGGLELGAGVMVDDRVGPERAAAELG
jgi:UDPglucose--hexose-1-phosphate uridylyltransferase